MFNGRIKRYDLDFSQEMRDKCVSDVDQLYSSGNWAKNIPHFQTWSTLFFRTEEHWVTLRESYRKCVADFIGVPTYHVEGWCVKSCPNIASWSPEVLWHNHNSKGSVVSGIFYLSLADDCGTTEFIDNQDNKIILPKDTNCWYLFDSSLYHRPEYWDHTIMKQNRYVIAADAY